MIRPKSPSPCPNTRAALHDLLRGFQLAHQISGGCLLQDVLAAAPAEIYGGLLNTILRLVVILYAEARGVFPDDSIYVRQHSVNALFEQLEEDAARDTDNLNQRFGAWSRLLALFRLIHDGGEHGSNRFPPRFGRLCHPDAYPFLEGRPRGSKRIKGEKLEPPKISDGVVHRVLRHLVLFEGKRIDYRSLAVEHIGSVYEAVMGFTVEVAADPSIATFVLRPTEERRRSGSHYTPRTLTEPIVETTLRPILEALGPNPRPEQILALKVCDPAMGSGAFLIAACRALGDKLVASWRVHGMPDIPAIEDRALFARRLVAQRCLYGVDKDPVAVDLAKLSLWLETLAKGHPFTFLDHALRHGDSLVGLSREQIASFSWASGGQIPTMQADLDAEHLRSLGREILHAYFSEKTDKARDALRRKTWNAWPASLPEADLAPLEAGEGKPPIVPFHWEIEFPEVFGRDNPGFDAFVGNPPFLGGRKIARSFGRAYAQWLTVLHEGASSAADISAHFFRRAFNLLRKGGTLGFIATNTIAQGDTRGVGLRWICKHGGTIYEATRRHKWPGSAVVVVSVVYVSRGGNVVARLDGKSVARISAFLFHRGGDDDPVSLASNAGKSFQGAVVLGLGFTFDAARAEATPLVEMQRLMRENPHNAERIFPYLGGEELNSSPTSSATRYVIHFGEMSEVEARRWPELMAIIEKKVKPERITKDAAKYPRMVLEWWKFWNSRPGLEQAIKARHRVLVCAQTSKYRTFTFAPTRCVFDQKIVVFNFDSYAAFAVLHARIHETWALFLGSTMKDDPVYTPTDCFQTFPFPPNWEHNETLEAIGKDYYEFRSALMAEPSVREKLMAATPPEGLTATYNRFHDPNERSSGILQLRQLHEAMDRAALDAYGWHDIRPRCEFLLDYEESEDDASRPRRRKKPWRYRWPEDVRDEVLARLLALNVEQAGKEKNRSGM